LERGHSYVGAFVSNREEIVIRPFLCLIAALCLLAATSPFRASSASFLPPTPLPHVAAVLAHGGPLRIAAFGSSSTWGAGASSRAASYPSRLEVELKKALPGVSVSVLNDGIGGQDADDFHLRVDTVLGQKPDLVVFQTGSNDPLRHVPLARFEAETRSDIARLHAAGIDVVLMEPQNCRVLDATPGWSAYLDAVRRIGAEMGVPVIRRVDLMNDWRAQHLVTDAELFAPDGLHMADGGYALLAQAVADEILRDSISRTVTAAK
jgi:acyl-CoA thioesterase I